jgi:hypothetical protein
MTTLLVNHSIINLKCHHSILYSTYIHSIEKNFWKIIMIWSIQTEN